MVDWNSVKVDEIVSMVDWNSVKVDEIVSVVDWNSVKVDEIVSVVDWNSVKVDEIDSVVDLNHWGSSHEGSGRHPRQHGGDAVAASASLWQILTVSVRYFGAAFVSWLSMLWDTLTRNSELQWFGISLQSRLKVSRGDEGVGHVCFPGDEGVGWPWRGYRCMQMNVGPA